MAPASATYQQAVPMPLIAPLKIRYYKNTIQSDIFGRFQKMCLQRLIRTHPLVAKFAVAIVCRTLNWECGRTDDKRPLNTNLVHDRAAKEAD